MPERVDRVRSLMDVPGKIRQLADKFCQRQNGSAFGRSLHKLGDEIEAAYNTLKVELDLECGAHLEMLLHPWGDHTWILSHRYRIEEERRVKLLCDWKCIVAYQIGVLQPSLSITMHVIIPERMGKAYLYGMDISPGAKTFFELEYEREGENPQFLLTKIRKGETILDLRELAKGNPLTRPIIIPFPLVVEDRVSQEHQEIQEGKTRYYGDYVVSFPYRTETGTDEIRKARFPVDLSR